MRPYTIKVKDGEAFELAAVGSYVRVRTTVADLTIECPDTGESAILSQGDDCDFSPFQRLRISHAAGTTQTVTLLISSGGKRAGSAQVGGSVLVSNMPNHNGVFIQDRKSVGNGAPVQLAPANTARSYLEIQNNDAAAVLRVTVQGTLPTALVGRRIPPGQSWKIDVYCPTGTIQGILETAASGTYNVEVIEG